MAISAFPLIVLVYCISIRKSIFHSRSRHVHRAADKTKCNWKPECVIQVSYVWILNEHHGFMKLAFSIELILLTLVHPGSPLNEFVVTLWSLLYSLRVNYYFIIAKKKGRWRSADENWLILYLLDFFFFFVEVQLVAWVFFLLSRLK